jgi:hypothetical protein
LQGLPNSDKNLSKSALYRLQASLNDSSRPDGVDPDATYNLSDNVATGKANIPLSVPGYMQLNYKTDFRWLTQGIGEGGTASISLAELTKSSDISRNDEDPKVAVKHYLDLKNVDKSIIKTNFLYEIAILS